MIQTNYDVSLKLYPFKLIIYVNIFTGILLMFKADFVIFRNVDIACKDLLGNLSFAVEIRVDW